MAPKICTPDRDELRRWIPAWYRPSMHAVGMWGTGLAFVLWLSLTYLAQASLEQLLLIPTLLFCGSLAEYTIHRWIMHVRRGWLPRAWEGHYGRHHFFFSDTRRTWDRVTDIWLVLFSPEDVVVLAVILAVPVTLVWREFGAVTGAATAVSLTLYFLFYEALHLSYHLPDRHWLLKLPGLAGLRAHHTRHHHPTKGDGNYAVVLPLWDHVFRTKLR